MATSFTKLELFSELGVSAYDRANPHSGDLGLFLRAAQEGKIERGSILAIEVLDRLTRAEPCDAFRLLVLGEDHPHTLNKEGKREPAGEPLAHYHPAIISE